MSDVLNWVALIVAVGALCFVAQSSLVIRANRIRAEAAVIRAEAAATRAAASLEAVKADIAARKAVDA